MYDLPTKLNTSNNYSLLVFFFISSTLPQNITNSKINRGNNLPPINIIALIIMRANPLRDFHKILQVLF